MELVFIVLQWSDNTKETGSNGVYVLGVYKNEKTAFETMKRHAEEFAQKHGAIMKAEKEWIDVILGEDYEVFSVEKSVIQP